MRRIALALILTASYSYASTCTDPSGVLDQYIGGLTIGGSAVTGCLSAGASSASNTGTLYVDAPSSYLSSTAPLTETWSVSEPTSGVYDYTYTFSNVSSTDAVSHLELGLGLGCTTFSIGASSDCISSLQINSLTPSGNQSTFTELYATAPAGMSNGNPNLPWTTETLQVFPGVSSAVTANFTVSFVSNEAPVWQNIYVRDGTTNSNEAYDVGACLISNACPAGATGGSYFSIAPGVPEPAFYGLLAFGMTGLLLARRASRKRSSAV